MHRHRLTRRQALHAGAAAVVAGALRPRTASAASEPSAFELPIDPGSAVADRDGWRRTPVLRAPRRFDIVGLGWTSGHVEAEVRARRAGGSWSPWLRLHALGDHRPDRSAPMHGTDPAYTAAADQLQLRLRGAASGLRARFVHAQPAARRARARAPLARVAVARRRAGVAQPPIISRDEWGAAAYPPRALPQYGQVVAAFVHHTVTANAYGPAESAGIVLGICRYHRNFNGWNDIGYNFLVDHYGQIFEGRGGGIDQAVIGAQAQGYNSWSTGVAVLGTHETVPAGEATLEALAQLIGWKLSIHAVPVVGSVTVTSLGGSDNRYASGTPVTLQRVGGHRDGDLTACPGTALYAQLPEIRRRAARYWGPIGSLAMRADSGITVRYPRPLVLTGWLRLPDGTTPPAELVSIELQTAGAAWTPVGEAVTDGTGTWHAEVALPASGTIRVVHAPSGLVSPLLSVGVVPRLTLVPRSTRVPAGTRLRLAGSYEPSVTPRPAQLLVERRAGRRYLRALKRGVTVRNGRYGTTVKLKTPGAYRVTVRVGDAVVRKGLRVTPV